MWARCYAQNTRKKRKQIEQCLRKIIESIRYLARQGLALEGHKDEADSNQNQSELCMASEIPYGLGH